MTLVTRVDSHHCHLPEGHLGAHQALHISWIYQDTRREVLTSPEETGQDADMSNT
jgi:hypothetical protein